MAKPDITPAINLHALVRELTEWGNSRADRLALSIANKRKWLQAHGSIDGDGDEQLTREYENGLLSAEGKLERTRATLALLPRLNVVCDEHHAALGKVLKQHGWDRIPADHDGITFYNELPRVEVQTEYSSCFLFVEYLPYAYQVRWYFSEGHVEGTFDEGEVNWALRSAIRLCAKDAQADFQHELEDAQGVTRG